MRDGWRAARLGDVAVWKKGRKPPRTTEEKAHGSIPYLTAACLRTGLADFYVPLEGVDECVVADDNSVLLLWDGAGAGDVFRGRPGVVASNDGPSRCR